MSHLRSISRPLPRRAESLLVTQQKVALFAGFAAAFNALGTAFATWQDLGNDEGGGE